MCIAILNSNNTPLSKKTLSNSWDNNNQGAGMLYNINNKLQVFKTFDKESFINEYFKIRKIINTPILLHFRISTSGQHNFENLHPFLITQNIGFIHNGIIDNGSINYSDTYLFNELLKNIQNIENLIFNKEFQLLISGYIGYSKLIFLNSNNDTLIINEHLGHYDNMGNWFSNDSYLQINDFKYYGNKKVFNNDVYYNENDFEHLDNDNWCGVCDGCLEQAEVHYSEQWESVLCKDCELVY